MLRVAISACFVLLLTFVVAGAAFAPYHTNPTPPPPSGGTAPSGLTAAKAQAKVAATHSGVAASGQTVSFAREHLGEALVCIEGKSGPNVKASWENPCQGMGQGVLADLQQAKADPALLQKAKTADAAAVAGMESSDLARIKAAAQQVATLMTQIAQAK